MYGTVPSGFRERNRRNGVASDFPVLLPLSSVLFSFLPFSSVSICFHFLLFFSGSVFFRFFPFSSVSFSEKKRGDTVRETPFAKPRFQRFCLSVQTVPLGKESCDFLCSLRGMFWFQLRFLKTVPTVPILLSSPGGKNTSDGYGFGSGSVPVPSCLANPQHITSTQIREKFKGNN